MLNAARQRPASIAKSLLSRSSSSRCAKFITIRNQLQVASRTLPTRSLRAISTTPQLGQRALASREVEEAEREHVDTQRPPLDSRIDEAVQHGPVTKFKDLVTSNLVCKTVVDTITQDMGLDTMTQVQSLTIKETLKGIDVLAQARTGTGKTLAFLIPVLQNIIKADPNLEKGRERYNALSMDIRAIIISPTRELAEQIAREAEKVTKNTGVVVQTAVGGTSKHLGLQKLRREGCHILVGTPGRLHDLLSDPSSRVKAPNLSAFVLDEADRLLDAGFAPHIEDIQKLLPNRRTVDRQTLLFSATVPREVMGIVRATMKPDFKFVRTVQDGEQQTHEKVPQKFIVLRGLENFLPTLVELCKRELAREDQPFKALVYLNTTAEVSLAYATLRSLRHATASEGGISHQHPLYPSRILEIHARLTQEGRTQAADNFRTAKNAILLSSDVTARGMDFPNVTHVIQFNCPPDRDTYIHRLGRTARADKGGEGWLFVNEFERRHAASVLRDIPLQPDTSLQAATIDMTKDASLPESIATILTQVIEASRNVSLPDKAKAYRSSLGLSNRLDDAQLAVNSLNDRARFLWGMEKPPPISRSLVQKLGLGFVRGFNYSMLEADRSNPGEGYGGSFGRGGSRPGFGGFGDRGRSSFGTGGGYGSRERGGTYSRGSEAPSGYGGYGDRGWSRPDRSSGYGDRGGSRPARSGGYGDRGGSRPDRSSGYGDRGRFGRNVENGGFGGGLR